MELLYIKSVESSIIPAEGVCLSNRFNIKYISDLSYYEITDSDYFIEDFFGDNITNLTAILGSNGAGKTTILRLLVGNYSAGVTYVDTNPVILFYFEDEILKYYAPEDIQINNSTAYKLKKISANEFDNWRKRHLTIYLSNHFDPTSLYSHDYLTTQLNGFVNLSSWYLLESDITLRKGVDHLTKRPSFIDTRAAFGAMELSRIVKTIRWFDSYSRETSFPNILPDYINLQLQFHGESIRKESEIIGNKLKSAFGTPKSSKTVFLINSFHAAVLHFMFEGGYSQGPDIALHQFDKAYKIIVSSLSKMNSSPSDIDGVFSTLQKINAELINKILPKLNEKFIANQTFFEKLYNFLKLPYSKVSHDGNTLSMPIKKTGLKKLIDLFEEFYLLDKIGDYLEFYLSHNYINGSNLSSGEYSLLSIFSRLNSSKLSGKKSMLLLLDESELALHPQWQKQFLRWLIKFVNDRYKGLRVQIVLTSHSPLLLSDLPPNCVVLIERKNGVSKIAEMKDRGISSFGANIFDIYRNDFFIDNGIIGEFAKSKINEIIECLTTKKKLSNKKIVEYRKIASLIGEPVIRNKLLGDLNKLDEMQ